MTPLADDKSEHNRRLDEVVTAYLREQELGHAPDPADWLARYPELAGDLAVFFTANDRVDQLAAPLRDVRPAPALEPATGIRAGAPADAPTTGLGDAAAAPAPGVRIQYFGDYELLQEIGRGGMGVVYKARQASLNRTVALKMILTGQLANDDDVKRFYAEARAAGNLQHEHIVPVFEVGEYDRHHYFTMAYIEGESLAHKLTAGMLPPRQAAELVKKIAKAVSYAHTEGVIHRDLKPANILLDKNGDPRLTDFGLAKRVQGEPGASATGGLTATGQILGTPSYMPPEQASGKKGGVGPLADVYSLGAILYCLLTARPPFQADNPFDTLMQVVEQEPVPPRQLNAKVPRDLETICLKCLEKEPHQRYAAACDLAEDLDRFLNGQAILARPVGRLERAWKWAKRRPAAAALVVALLVASIAPVVVGGIYNTLAVKWARVAKEAQDNANQLTTDLLQLQNDAFKDREAARISKADAEKDRALAQVEKERADIASKRIGKDIYVAEIRLAQKAFDETRIGRVHELLDGQLPERTVGVDLRGFEWHYLKRLLHMELFDLQAPAGAGGFCINYSPDGKYLVTGGANGVLKLWDAATGKELRKFEGIWEPVWRAVFSPDSKWIASGNGEFGSVYNRKQSQVIIWDVNTGKVVRKLQEEGLATLGLAFNADGSRLAVATADKMIKIWNTATGEEVHKIPSQHKVNAVAYSPVANHLAWVTEYNASTGQSVGDVYIWDLTTNKRITGLSGNLGRLFGVAFSPDGKRVAASGDRGVKVWEAASGKEVHYFQATQARFQNHDVKFSRDGKRLASGDGSQVIIWDAITGSEIHVFKGHTGFVHSLSFSPDGKRLATTDGWNAKIWDANKSHEPITVLGEMGWAFGGAAFRPDGKRLAVGIGNGQVKIVDPATGAVERLLKGHTGWVKSLDWSADGQRLVTASLDKTAKIWDTATWQEIHTLKGHGDEINGIAISPDGTRVATGGGTLYGTVGQSQPRLAGQVVLWDAATGKELRRFKVATVDKERPHVTSVAFSPDGRWLAAGLTQHARPDDKTHDKWKFYSGAIVLWEVATGNEIAFLPDNHHVNGVAFSKDGTRIASACLSNTLKMWDTATWKELHTFKGHTGDANSVAFSPDGKRLASISDDRTVRLWDTATGQELFILKAPSNQTVVFSPDGNRLVATGEALRIWDATPRE